jgi:hypothetical protein
LGEEDAELVGEVVVDDDKDGSDDDFKQLAVVLTQLEMALFVTVDDDVLLVFPLLKT